MIPLGFFIDQNQDSTKFLHDYFATACYLSEIMPTFSLLLLKN